MVRRIKITLLMLLCFVVLQQTQSWASCDSSPNAIIPHNSIGVSDVITNSGSIGTLGNGVTLEEVCVLIEHDYIGYLDIILTSPSGTQLSIFDGNLLSTNPNYAITDDLGLVLSQTEVCFTPEIISEPYIYLTDTNNIGSFYGSVTGSWLPVEDFSAFNGDDANGDWTISVVEEFPILNLDGTFISWSIGFSNGDCFSTTGLPSFYDTEVELSLEGLGGSYCQNDPAVTLQPIANTNLNIPPAVGQSVSETNSAELMIPYEAFMPVSSFINVSSFPDSSVLLNESDISVTLDINYTWIGDISAWLTAPCGVIIPLFDRPGYPEFFNPFGSNSDMVGIYTFTMDGDDILPQTQVFDTIPNGNYLPEISFETLVGCELNGDWELTIIDAVTGDTGSVYEWSLDLIYELPNIANDLVGSGVTDSVVVDTLEFTFNPALADVGINEIVYSYEHINGLIFTDTFSTYVYQTPQLDTIEALHLCESETIELTDFNPTETDGLTGTYQWFSDEFLSTPIINTAVSTAGTYYVQFETLDGACTDTASLVLTNTANVSVLASNTGPYCAGDFIQLESAVGSTTAEVTYLWTGPAGSGFSSNLANPAINTNVQEGTYFLQVIANGCLMDVSSTEVAFGQVSPPQLTLPIEPICDGDAIKTYSLDQVYSSYNWTVTGGTIVGGGGPSQNFATVFWSGDGTLAVNIEDGNSCFGENEWTVDFLPIPDPQFITASYDICDGTEEVLYQLSQSYPTINWNITNGTVVNGGGTSDSYAVINWDTSAPAGSIDIEVLNEADCPKNFSENISFIDLPEPTFIDLFAQEACPKEPITYQLNQVFDAYDWDITGGEIIAGGEIDTNFITILWDEALEGNLEVSVEQTGCFGENIETIVINTPAQLAFTDVANEVCKGVDNEIYTLSDDFDTYEWVVTGGTITSGGNPTDAFVSVNWNEDLTPMGTIDVLATSQFGCQRDTSINVVVRDLPIADFNSPDTIACQGEAIVYTLSSAGINENCVWQVDGGTMMEDPTLPEHQVMVQWDDTGLGTVGFIITNEYGCSIEKNIDISVSDFLEPLFVTPIEAVCVSIDDTLTYLLSGVAADKQVIVNNGVLVAELGNEIKVVWNQNGEGSIEVETTNDSGCTSETSVVVTVSENPNPVFALAPTAVCAGETDVAYELMSDDFTDFQWSVNGGTIVTGGGNSDSLTIDWGTDTTGLIQLQVGNAANCLTQIELPIVINPLPEPLMDTPLLAVCKDDNGVNYQLTESYDNYHWSVMGGTINGDSLQANVAIDWNTEATNGVIEVLVVDEHNCQNQITENIVINALPELSWNNQPLTICENVGAVLYEVPADFSNYDWQVVNGLVESGGNADEAFIEVNWDDTAVNHSVNLIVTNENNCQTAEDFDVEIIEEPSIVFDAAPMIFCESIGDVEYRLAPGFTDYDWQINGGIVVDGAGSTDDFAVVKWPAGSGNVQVLASNDYGCSAGDTLDINIGALISGSISPNNLICKGEEVDLLAEGGDSYSWYANTSLSDDAIPNPMANPDSTTTYQVVIENNQGCVDTLQTTVEVRPDMEIAVEESIDFCPFEPILLNALGENFENASWSTTTVGTWSDSTQLNTVFTPLNEEESISFVLSLENICDSISQDITFNQQENPIDISLKDDLIEICEGELALLESEIEAPLGAVVTWNGGQGSFTQPMEASTTYTPGNKETGMLDIEVEVESGCHTKTAFINLLINPILTLETTPDTTVYFGESTMLGVTGDPMGNYLWTSSTSLSCGNCVNPSASPTETITYQVSSSNECAIPTAVTVTVDKSVKVLIPNAFSPNGDGMNDWFLPMGHGYVVNRLMIFNRYGEKVYDVSGPTNGWDGTYRNIPQSSGVFTYVCEYESFFDMNRKIKKGSLTLIR